MPQNVQLEEDLSSFIREREEVYQATQQIKPRRLQPRRNESTNRLELSVCRSSGLSEPQLWAICAEHFDPRQKLPAIGRCVAPASKVFGVGLEIDADGRPYPQHANVIGWKDEPGRPENEIKHHWLDQTQRMAKHFKFQRRSNFVSIKSQD